MKIGEREIGAGHEPYIIAEIGVNHDGSVERALELTDAAARAGADAVKLQYFETDRLMSRAAKLAAYQRSAGETDPVEMLRRLELPPEEMARVAERAHGQGLHAIVTVFSVELVESACGVPWDAFKSASPDLVHRPLLEALAATGKPLVVSTGASTLDEVARARDWLRGAHDRLALLHCVSAYPTPLEAAALAGCEAIAAVWDGPVGYSDHTSENNTATLLAPLGVSVFEKHLTYSTSAAGPDHAASLNPADFARYVELTRGAFGTEDGLDAVSEARLHEPFATYFGPPEKRVLECERDVREVARQSIVPVRALPAGHVARREDLTFKRPGTGIEPWRIGEVVGRELAGAAEADAPLPEAVLG